MLQAKSNPQQPLYTPNTEELGQFFAEPMCGAVEALLFAAERPLSIEEITQFLEAQDYEVDRHMVEDIVRALAELYQQPGRGLQLLNVAGGWQFRTNPAYALMVRRLIDPRVPRFTQAALECLSIIAYRQPVTRGEVDAIRGVDSGGVMLGLRERGLIEIAGRSNAPGRPYIYQTSPQFLEFFGLDGLEELPMLSAPGLAPPPPAPGQHDPAPKEPPAMQP